MTTADYDHDPVRCEEMIDLDCDTLLPGSPASCCVCLGHNCEAARAEREKHPAQPNTPPGTAQIGPESDDQPPGGYRGASPAAPEAPTAPIPRGWGIRSITWSHDMYLLRHSSGGLFVTLDPTRASVWKNEAVARGFHQTLLTPDSWEVFPVYDSLPAPAMPPYPNTTEHIAPSNL